ncbi:hypothetical protein QQ045_010274 [Rhodiola kirilowii]
MIALMKEREIKDAKEKDRREAGVDFDDIEEVDETLMDWIVNNRLDCIALLEVKLQESRCKVAVDKCCPGGDWKGEISLHFTGWSRILTLWNADSCGVWVVNRSSHFIIFEISSKYWEVGSLVRERDITDFGHFINSKELADLDQSGCFYTWNNNHEDPESRIWCKLDRAMGNRKWFEDFPDVSVVFMPPDIFDPSPILISWGVKDSFKKSFRYCRFWESIENYDGFSAGFSRQTGILLVVSYARVSVISLSTMLSLRGINSAVLALFPKHALAYLPEDYMPISCCNVIYKIISSVLATRLKAILPCIINPAQGVFVGGRSIVGNLNVAQQLVAGYDKKNISERITWNVDLRKAYDTVCWDFLDSMLQELKFPVKFIAWIRMCVRSTYFSVPINGEMVDYFEGKRGFCQGDPISPFLFTIVMEYLSRLLTRLDKSAGFYHHPKCHRIDLKHILFADDLFLFSNGRCSSILAIKDVVERFLSTSGLAINLSKSQVFTAGMSPSKIILVKGVLSTAVAKLPVRYLGIPLSSKKLSSSECSNLLNKIISRINAWSNRFLSRPGRCLLIQSILHSTVFY